jgi:general secretion pathway protein K
VLIKGFTPSIVYGGPGEDPDDDPYLGIASWLTTWGDGKVNVNTASREVLMTIPGLEDYDVDAILEGRLGEDGEAGTKDDGFKTVDEVMAKMGLSDGTVAEKLTTTEHRFVRVISIGESQGVRSGVWAIFDATAENVYPVFWREEDMP